MTKRIGRITIFFVIFILLSSLGYSPQEGADVYVIEGRLNWKDSFREPFEVLYLILYDSTMIGLTTQEEHRINVTPTFIEEYLRLKEKKISDIAIMVHNHYASPFPSWGNGLFLKALRNRGFKGSFGVYHVPSDTIKWMARDED